MVMADYPLQQRTIGRVLADKARRIPDKPFLLWQQQVFSYADLERITNRYANGFAALGIGHGDTVAVMLPNSPEFLWVVWGLAKLGAVGVPLNTAARGDMLQYFLSQSEARMLVIDSEWTDRLQAVASSLPSIQTYAFSGALPDAAFAALVPHARILPLPALPSGNDTAPPIDRVSPDDAHLIVYTSGTTGPSKGVLCPHSQALGVGRAISTEYGYRSDDVIYACLPLFHVNALWYSCTAALWAEARFALSERFSATRFWDEIRDYGATQFNSLGAMTNILLQLPEGPQDRNHRLRQIMAVPMTRDLYTELRRRYGVEVTSLFAMSENYAVTIFVPGDREDKLGSAGSARGASRLRIADDEGASLAPGEVGEIQLQPLLPGTMMKGYYRMPEQTAQAFIDGWFCTGDRGYLDEDGYLYFIDRKKEAIRRRGENISAYEVEMILSRHPGIHEVAAVPVPSEMSEDEVMVYVVTTPGASLTHAQVIEFATEHMSYFMVPRFVEFIDALPKTATEKIEKYKLKQDALSRRTSLWDREREGIRVAR
ncbi:MAG: AMP-binding protein [Burkholderiales bacterium]